ncbi:MAG: 16S rRNA (guanine(527)-N(7))-methyltransferase RsmG [Ruminococcaceae bacterium]|nr:16S rRNA (guanine(527)-N(7))-methyltransferase RsmG [Oscillospiraceae bacterium]
MTEENKRLLIEGFSQFDIEVTEEQILQLEKYMNFLLEKNKVMNLTAITDEAEFIVKHFVDSVSIIPALREYNVSSLIDVGTGAGFPGIPVKIMCPDINICLIDSTGKRIRFLDEVISLLSLTGIKTIQTRAEELGRNPEHREQYDAATARAVAPLNSLLEYCMPFVKVGGIFISMKGLGDEPSYSYALKALCGYLIGEEKYDLKVENQVITHRNILVKKTNILPTRYPRNTAIITKKPL